MKNILWRAKFFSTWRLDQMFCWGLYLTYVPGWVSAPQAHCRVSNIIFACCGLEVQKPTQALTSVKGPGNTFDLNSKWARTLPGLKYFSWDIYRDPLHNFIF
jgi:hypothetical protein